MGYLLGGIVGVLDIVFNMIQILIFASIVISWVDASPSNQIVGIIRSLTEPMYRPIRKWTQNIPGPFDWAPMILILVIIFLQLSLLRFLRDLAH